MKAIKTNIFIWIFTSLFISMTSSVCAQNNPITSSPSEGLPEDSTGIRNVLFIGDSMTGWLAERLNAYGDLNGFNVATVVWDGSTIQKWAKTPGLSTLIEQISPDAILICLGMNELFEPNPESKLSNSIDKLKNAFGEIPYLWIGPPSWPGHTEGGTLNNWLEEKLGEKNFFKSFDLDLSRQSKSNPHPSKKGIEEWMDLVVEWIPDNSNLVFRSLVPPEKGVLSRGKPFIYKRMKEPLQ